MTRMGCRRQRSRKETSQWTAISNFSKIVSWLIVLASGGNQVAPANMKATRSALKSIGHLLLSLPHAQPLVKRAKEGQLHGHVSTRLPRIQTTRIFVQRDALTRHTMQHLVFDGTL